jgi:hypothetical protein
MVQVFFSAITFLVSQYFCEIKCKVYSFLWVTRAKNVTLGKKSLYFLYSEAVWIFYFEISHSILFVWMGFMSHRHSIVHLAMFQLYLWRKTSDALRVSFQAQTGTLTFSLI